MSCRTFPAGGIKRQSIQRITLSIPCWKASKPASWLGESVIFKLQHSSIPKMVMIQHIPKWSITLEFKISSMHPNTMGRSHALSKSRLREKVPVTSSPYYFIYLEELSRGGITKVKNYCTYKIIVWITQLYVRPITIVGTWIVSHFLISGIILPTLPSAACPAQRFFCCHVVSRSFHNKMKAKVTSSRM